MVCTSTFNSNNTAGLDHWIIWIEFDTIISGVAQGSIFRPILYNIFFNNFFFFISKVPVHNFADDNTLASFLHSKNYCQFWNQNVKQQLVGFTITK